MSPKPSDIPQMSIARPWDSAHWFRPPQMQIPFGRKAIPVLVNYFGGPMIIALISIRRKKGGTRSCGFYVRGVQSNCVFMARVRIIKASQAKTSEGSQKQ